MFKSFKTDCRLLFLTVKGADANVKPFRFLRFSAPLLSVLPRGQIVLQLGENENISASPIL